MTPRQAIARKHELLKHHTEQYLLSTGWTERMIGHCWFWSRTLTIKGIVEQFTARNTEHAYQLQRILEEIASMYPEKAPNEA